MAAPTTQQKTGPKKVIDSWKGKKWYTVVAPNFLNNIEAAEVPALEDATLINRIISIPLKEITHDMSHMYTTVRLRVAEIQGKKAFSKYIGHKIAREYLRTLVRRRRDVVDVVFDAKSSDGIEFRIKAMAVTQNPCSEKQKTALRNLLSKELRAKAESEAFGDFVQDVLFNKANAQMHEKLEKIMPIRRVEVWKTELKEEFDTEKEADGETEDGEETEGKEETAPAKEERAEEILEESEIPQESEIPEEAEQTPQAASA